MSFRRVCDWLVYLAVRVFVCIVQAMPMETCQVLARCLAVVARDVVRIRRRVVDDNLRHAFPDWSAAERRRVALRIWEHLALMVCEIAHVPRKFRETTWRRYVRLENVAEEVRLLLGPRPVVLLTGHFGNFEVAGYLAGLFGFPTFTIARPLDNPFLDRFVHRFRGAKGQRMLPKKRIAGQVANLLEQGRALALLGDQFGGSKGCWIDFFGRPASYHKAIALFSLTSRAPLVVTYVKRLGRPLHFELGVLGVFDPDGGGPETRGARELIQCYNDLLEKIIRTDPGQYWWVHRRWKDPQRKHRRKSEHVQRDPPQTSPGAPVMSLERPLPSGRMTAER